MGLVVGGLAFSLEAKPLKPNTLEERLLASRCRGLHKLPIYDQKLLDLGGGQNMRFLKYFVIMSIYKIAKGWH